MKVSEYGVVIESFMSGENNAVTKVFTQSHGVLTGFAKRVKTQNKSNIFVPGNVLKISYFQREGVMGSISGEPYSLYMYNCMDSQKKMKLILAMCECLKICFFDSEKTSSSDLFSDIVKFLEGVKHDLPFEESIFNLTILIKKILSDCGYSFSLDRCIHTGTENIDELQFVSPKSAAAVCRASGEPYANLMLSLPKSFITNDYLDVTHQKQLTECLKIVDYFIKKVYSKQSIELTWLINKIEVA